MKQQDVKFRDKPWVRNLISFSTGIVTFFLIGGIPLIIYSKRVDAVIPMIFFGVFIAPLASGFVCGLLVHEKGRYVIIVSFPVLLLAVGYIVIYATGSNDWAGPVFPAMGGGTAFFGSFIGLKIMKLIREIKSIQAVDRNNG